MPIIETAINGILFGGTYSLVAIGFTLIFGVIHRLNVAHGATIMVSAYGGATVTLILGGNSYFVLILAFLVSISIGSVLGLIVERIAFRPLRDASYLAPFVTTIGVTIFLEELFLHISRKVPIFYPEYTPFHSPLEYLGINLGPYYIRGVYIAIFIVSISLMFILHVWVTRTRTGRAMRVVEESPETARLMGINVVKTEVVAFVVASALAGAAGCLIGVSVGTINPFMATHLLLVSFVVIVMGGMGNMYGAMIGGIIVGALEKLSVSLWSSSYREAILFAILFAILLIKPEGLFTVRAQKRD
jgi:branched-chain amino acid transport system permease protein